MVTRNHLTLDDHREIAATMATLRRAVAELDLSGFRRQSRTVLRRTTVDRHVCALLRRLRDLHDHIGDPRLSPYGRVQPEDISCRWRDLPPAAQVELIRSVLCRDLHRQLNGRVPARTIDRLIKVEQALFSWKLAISEPDEGELTGRPLLQTALTR